MAQNNVIRRDVVQIGFEVDRTDISKLDRALEDVNDSSLEMAKSAQKAADEVADIGTEATKAAKSSEKLKNSGLKDAEEDARAAANSTRKFRDETRESGKESEESGRKTKKSSHESKESVEDLTASVGELTGAFASVATAFAVGQIIQGVNEVNQAMNKLRGQTGATAAEMVLYKDVVQDLYTSGSGQTIGDVADSMALVNQQFKDLDSDTMRNITKDAMVLVDTFDADLNETLRGANALMTNMGLSAQEAFDYIAKGTQNGLDKSHELSDNIAEYSQLWAQAGFSAEEMFTVLQNGLDSGAYNLDKVNDFVKEFSISLSDGRIAENIDSFSNTTQTLFEEWRKGEASQKDVFNSIINDLSSMTNEQEALTVASTVWSALGEDNAMKVITSLNKVNTTYADVGDTMKSINEIRYDDLGSSLERVSRSGGELLEKTLAQPLSKFNNVLADGIDGVSKFVDENEALATGATAAALAAAGLATGTMAVVTAVKFVPPAIAKVSASFAALNISMGAVGIAILAVSAAVGLVTAAVKASDESVGKYDGTLEECRAEIKRTEEAHRKAVERYGKNSEAAKQLEKDIDKLNKQYERGGGVVAEMNERVEENSKAFAEMSEAQNKAISSLEKSEVNGLQAVSMLESLSSKAQLTTSDLDLMSEYADYLNDTFNCNIKVNYDTGELTGFNPDVVVKQIIDAANDQKVQSAMAYLSGEEFTDGYIEAAKNVTALEEAYAEAKKEYEKLRENAHTSVGYAASNSPMMKQAEEVRELKDALSEAEGNLSDFDKELENYGSIVDESGKTTEMLRDAFIETAESGGEFIRMAEEAAESSESVKDSFSMAEDAVAEYNDQLYNLAKAYDEALLAAQESVAGQYSAWDEVGDIAETSIGELQSALQSQSDYWADYAENLALLQEKAQSIEGLSDLLATMADGSEDSASAIAALAGASDEELSNVVADWQSVKDKQDEASQNMALTQTEFQTKLSAMGVDMQGFVEDMDMSTQATTNASTTINAFIDTILTTITTRKSEVTSALSSLMSAASSYNLQISTPVEGNATGTTNSADTFVAGEEGAELVVGKKGSTVFPASETDKVIRAVQDYAGYSPKASAKKVVQNNTTYAPQFTLHLNGASASKENERTVKRWIKEGLNEVFNNLATENQPLVEV
jgi:phage-related minor tail protein